MKIDVNKIATRSLFNDFFEICFFTIFIRAFISLF